MAAVYRVLSVGHGVHFVTFVFEKQDVRPQHADFIIHPE